MPISVPVADRAAVQDGMMADRHVLADRQRRAGIGMEHRGFLDIAARADDDRGVVRADHGAEPDAGVIAEPCVADHVCARRDPGIGAEGRSMAANGIAGHGDFPSS